MKTKFLYGWGITCSYMVDDGTRDLAWVNSDRSASITDAVHGQFCSDDIEKVGRTGLWRRLQRKGFKCERVCIQVVAEINVGRRCCDDCLHLKRFTNDKGEGRLNCGKLELPSNAATIDTSTYICKYHQYYHEVFPV